jgi:hypothetical protein
MGERFWNTAIVAVAAGLAGGFAAYFLTGWIFTEYAWCVEGEEHCIRDWVAALSGYFAVVAAGVTAWVIWRQIVTANQHQAENVALQVMGRTALCRQIERETRVPMLVAQGLRNFRTEMAGIIDPDRRAHAVTSAIRMLEAMPLAFLKRFDDEIGWDGGPTAESLAESVEQLSAALALTQTTGLGAPPDAGAGVEAWAVKLFDDIATVRARAANFIGNWDRTP